MRNDATAKKLLLRAFPAWTVNDLARPVAGMFPVLKYLNTIDKHMLHAGGILVRLFVSGVILNRRRVENNDIGVVALF